MGSLSLGRVSSGAGDGNLGLICEEAEAALVVARANGRLDSTADSMVIVSLAGTLCA